MNENKRISLIDSLISIVPLVLAFLMPLFFLPLTTEFFEFNKLTLLTAATVLLAILWIARMILVKKVYFTKSSLDLALLLFLISLLLSSVFSLDKVSSLFGSYGRWFPSLFSFVVLFVFYYFVSSNVTSLKVVRGVVMAFLISATISTLVALLGYFGIKLGGSPIFQSPEFNLAGSSMVVSLMSGLAMLIALAYLLNTKSMITKILMAQFFVFNFIGIALLGYLSTFIAIGIGLVAISYLTSVENVKNSKVYLLALAGIAAAVVLVLVLPSTKRFIVNKNSVREISLSGKESRIVTFSVLRDYPLIGSGLSTFYLDFPTYKSLELNAGNLWNVRFDKPYSEAFNIVSSMGILGIIVTIVLGMKVFHLFGSLKTLREETGLLTALGACMLAVGTYFIFSYATVLTAFLFFMFLALVVGSLAVMEQRRYAQSVNLSLSSLSANHSSMSILSEVGEKSELLPYLVAVPVLGLLILGSFNFYKLYAGEYFMRKSVVAAMNNNGGLMYDYQGKAININPRMDVYHSQYARTNILLANALASNKDITETDKQNVQTLISQAIRSTRNATEVLNPLSVSNWETRAFIYRSLTGAAQDADQWAIDAYNAAIQLDPTNPSLRLDLGGVYFGKKDYLNAANLFRQSVSLKSDYANAHYNFAYALVQLKSYADAQRELETVKSLVPVDSADYTKISADLAEVAKLVAANPTVDPTKPSVAQLETPQGANGTQPVVSQEPLAKPGATAPLAPVSGN